MPIIFKKGEKRISFDEYRNKTKRFLDLQEPETQKSKDVFDSILFQENRNKAMEERRSLQKKYEEIYRKKRSHGTALSDNEIFVGRNRFAVNVNTGEKFCLVMVCDDYAEIKFSNAKEDLQKDTLFYEKRGELVNAYIATHGKYFYRTPGLYEGFPSGYYTLVPADDGCLRINERYQPERMREIRFILGIT